MKKERGITLIALVITIIILLILAGITITFMLGDNGILNKATSAGEKYSEQVARERLEIALADLASDKVTNSEYNETTFIDNNLMKENMIVNGDIVIVDGWQFEIDRSVPKIVNSMGKGQTNEQIVISANAIISSDYVKSTITVEIHYTGTITSITIGGETIAIPTKVDDKYVIQKEVIKNGTYGILVKDDNGGYKTASIRITEITEDMDIYTIEDLLEFKAKVEKGATFTDRQVRVKKDIDLSSICGAGIGNWEMIGKPFNGRFDGENHKLINLYFNGSTSRTALFYYVSADGIVENLILENCNIYNECDEVEPYIAGITNILYGTIRNCSVSGKIENIRSTVRKN